MQKLKKLTSDYDEVRSQKSHYTNVSKTSSKHVELSLEVEMDDEVREIIKSPKKCSSALLDVTVIKPKGLDRFTTEKQVLKMDQVKRMIATMQLASDDKKTLMEKLFGENVNIMNEQGENTKERRESRKRKSCLSSKNRSNLRQSSIQLEQGDVRCVTDETNSAVYSIFNQSRIGGIRTQQQHQQIYTSPRTYDNIRTMFACMNKDRNHNDNEKLEQPCLCQNCAIVGILTDSQKIPFATEPIPEPAVDLREPREVKESKEPSKYRRPSRRKSVSFKHLEQATLPSTNRVHEHEQCQAVFQLLSSRINELERRIVMQEEKAVPKDYFKKIITKLVTHLTRLTHYTEERTVTSSPRQKETAHSSTKYRSNNKTSRYYVNPVLVEQTFKVPAEKEYEPKPCSSVEAPKSHTESIWRWGGEFLTSGRDLKNKVVVLLEETLHNLKKGWEKPESQDRFDDEMQMMVSELSKNLAETVRTKSHRTRPSEEASIRSGRRMMHEAKNPVKQVPNFDRKSARPSLIPRVTRRNGPSVNVAYVNPQLNGWPEESAVSFKIDSSDYEVQKETMSYAKRKQYRKEFLKVLANTKTADKFKLWQNIWNQALENRQTKKDVVTIQIPDPKDLIRQRMIHLEYTIGELEQLLTSASTGENNKNRIEKK